MAQNKTNFVGRPCGPQLFLNCRATFQDDLTEVLGITSSRKAEHIIIPASKTNYSTFKKNGPHKKSSRWDLVSKISL